MDIHINPVSGATQVPPPVAKVSTDKIALVQPVQPPTPAPAPAAAVQSPAASQGDEYEAALRQAALSFKNVYAVSDTNFTIFKDTTGKYITRYVSLRDGSVTYVPEPTLVKQMQMEGRTRLSIDA